MLRALDKMPEDLNGVYQAILLRIPPSDQKFVREALLWLSFALEPLTLAALSDAVVLEEDDHALNNESRFPDSQVLLEMCHGLITYDKETSGVSLAHSTVRTFLTSIGIHSGPLAVYHLDEASAQHTMYSKCFTYLSFDDFKSPCQNWEDLQGRYEKFPLLKFAADNWLLHFNRWTSAQGPSMVEIERLVKFFSTRKLAEGGNFTSWVQSLLWEAPLKTSRTTEPLYYAAFFGLQPVVEKLLQSGADLDTKGGRRVFSTPLLAACSRGHLSIARILLEAGADPNPTNQEGISCIHFTRNFKGMKQLLCEYGAKDCPLSHYIGDVWTCCRCGSPNLDLLVSCTVCGHRWCPECLWNT